MSIERVESSSCLTEHASKFPNSDVTIGTRVGPHLVFPTYLTALVFLLMSRGIMTEFGGSNVTELAVVTVSKREFWLISTSSLVPGDAPEKHMLTMTLFLLETTMGM